MKELFVALLIICSVAVAYAAPQLIANPGATNEGVQTFAPIPAHSRTYTNGTKTMKCYSTSGKIMAEFDARVVGASTAVIGKFSINRSTTNHAAKSTGLYAIQPSGVTSFCFTPYSSQTQVESSWRGM